jgi:hypothetical protein
MQALFVEMALLPGSALMQQTGQPAAGGRPGSPLGAAAVTAAAILAAATAPHHAAGSAVLPDPIPVTIVGMAYLILGHRIQGRTGSSAYPPGSLKAGQSFGSRSFETAHEERVTVEAGPTPLQAVVRGQVVAGHVHNVPGIGGDPLEAASAAAVRPLPTAPDCNQVDILTVLKPLHNMGSTVGKFSSAALFSGVFLAWVKRQRQSPPQDQPNAAKLLQQVDQGILDLIQDLSRAPFTALQYAVACQGQYTAAGYTAGVAALLRQMRLRPSVWRAGTAAAYAEDIPLLQSMLKRFSRVVAVLGQLFPEGDDISNKIREEGQLAVEEVSKALSWATEQLSQLQAAANAGAAASTGSTAADSSGSGGEGSSGTSSGSGSSGSTVDLSRALNLGGQLLELSQEQAQELQRLTALFAALGLPGGGGDARILIIQGLLGWFIVDGCIPSREYTSADLVKEWPCEDLLLPRLWLQGGRTQPTIPPHSMNRYSAELWKWATHRSITAESAAAAVIAELEALRNQEAAPAEQGAGPSSSGSSQAGSSLAAAPPAAHPAVAETAAGAAGQQQQQQQQQQQPRLGARCLTRKGAKVFSAGTILGDGMGACSAEAVGVVSIHRNPLQQAEVFRPMRWVAAGTTEQQRQGQQHKRAADHDGGGRSVSSRSSRDGECHSDGSCLVCYGCMQRSWLQSKSKQYQDHRCICHYVCPLFCFGGCTSACVFVNACARAWTTYLSKQMCCCCCCCFCCCC